MGRYRCANCGSVFAPEDQVCPGCGYGVEAVGIEEPGFDAEPGSGDDLGSTCPECGSDLGAGGDACPSCGAPLGDP